VTFHHERRLQRALYHLDNLEAEIAAWVEEGPYRTWSEPDVDSAKKVLRVEVLGTPPPELSLIVGDCLHNLRCSLDNLVLELAIAFNNGRPVSSSIESDSGFPIFIKENPSKFDNMLRGINPRAKTVIEGLQPYTRGERAKTDPLWWLNKLENMDKHRLPHLVFFTPSSLGFIVPGDYVTDEIEVLRWGPVEDRAPIARYPAFDKTGAEVDVNLHPTFSVSFGKRIPEGVPELSVPHILRVIHRRIVRNVLPDLKEFLT
jgi:hypothetical protein